MERTFGIEIEFNGITASAAVRAIRSTGVECLNLSDTYHHTSFQNWKIKYDVSVNRTGCGPRAYGGNELVSPILRGEAGLIEVFNVCRVLEEAGAKIDKTCGLHVHIGVDAISKKEMKNLLRGWTRYEKVIDLFMPNSRRGNNNQYCKSILSTSTDLNYRGQVNEGSLFEYIDNVDSFTAVQTLAQDRYGKMNFTGFASRGTIEFRGHSGTVSGKKVCAWIQFCTLFIDTFTTKRTNSSSSPCVHRWLTVGVSDMFTKMQSMNMEAGTMLRRFYQARIKTHKRNERRSTQRSIRVAS